LTLTLLIKSPI